MVFGYSQTQGEHWFKANPYKDKEIKEIEIPEERDGQLNTTSIPSPLARFDLIEQAFNNINSGISTEGDKKLVSYTLDIAEIFFKLDRLNKIYNAGLEIIPWQREECLEMLRSLGSSPGHKVLAKALEVFLNQEKERYRTDKWHELWLLKVKNKIIGSTSPLTMFAPAGNIERLEVSLVLQYKNISPYQVEKREAFKKPVPLKERDEEFKRYMYKLHEDGDNTPFRTAFPALNTYIANQLKEDTAPQKESRSSELIVDGKRVTICRVNILKENFEADEIIKKSRVVLALGKKATNDSIKPPLVLPQHKQGRLEHLPGQEWNPDDKINQEHIERQTHLPIEHRTLPNTNIKYPFVTDSDFLSQKIIVIPYPQNEKAFHKLSAQRQAILYPLTNEFFKYFTVEDLFSEDSNTPKIEVKVVNEDQKAKSIKIDLYIPTKIGNKIKFTKIYHSNDTITVRANIAMAPLIKLERVFYALQILCLAENYQSPAPAIKLEFYSNSPENEQPQQLTEGNDLLKLERSPGKAKDGNLEHYWIKKEFDYIAFYTRDGDYGVIFPKWKNEEQVRPSSKFHFAVDFGTNNTHIEYSIESDLPQPFEINNDQDQDQQVYSLIDFTKNQRQLNIREFKSIINAYFVPERIHTGSKFCFPQSTILLKDKANSSLGIYPLLDSAIGFAFGKEMLPEGATEAIRNLKWDNSEYGQGNVKRFLSEIVFLIRNKVLLNNGSLSETKITWLYPSSMSQARKKHLGALWKELCECYMENCEVQSIVESLAPYYYYRSTNPEIGGIEELAISIDIGGGTSDIVFYENKNSTNNESNIQAISSVRFAGNVLFGNDALHDRKKLPEWFKKITKKILEETSSLPATILHPDLKKRLGELIEDLESMDYEYLNRLLFTLEKQLKPHNLEESFLYTKKIEKHPGMKMIILYFYSALIYYVTKFAQEKDLGVPRSIAFSGNGSRILSMLNPNQDYTSLAEFTAELVREASSSGEIVEKVRIFFEEEEAKQLSAKGAILCKLNPKDKDEMKQYIYTKMKIHKEDGIFTIDKIKSEEGKEIIEHVLECIDEFHKSFKTASANLNLRDKFDISASIQNEFFAMLNNNKDDMTRDAIVNFIESHYTSSENQIESDPFFVPVVLYIGKALRFDWK